ncbi:MAG: hypothetical protein H0W40_19360 [Methylibium sp.]|uniref:hypothetical protein n=1 Tax=Methylibium sp. TaxID=2067992 RepID=UPI00183CBDCD|nr:hypothetical protein [Methylibium sp.]MBA3599504.1 hypothetical protein [Methylibium sp.]
MPSDYDFSELASHANVSQPIDNFQKQSDNRIELLTAHITRVERERREKIATTVLTGLAQQVRFFEQYATPGIVLNVKPPQMALVAVLLADALIAQLDAAPQVQAPQ